MVKLYWHYSDVTCCEWRVQNVVNNGGTVIIAIKHLDEITKQTL